METAPHGLKKRLAALVLSLLLLVTCLPGALAVDLNVDAGFYFKQSRGGTCTLASAAMMLRRRAYLDGLTDWIDVTENSVKSSAWAGGLSHSFNYKGHLLDGGVHTRLRAGMVGAKLRMGAGRARARSCRHRRDVAGAANHRVLHLPAVSPRVCHGHGGSGWKFQALKHQSSWLL